MIKLTLAALVSVLLLLSCGGPSRPDLTLLHNATIYTVDPQLPVAQAMLFNDQGEIVAVGDFEQLMLQYAGAQPLDARGATVVPGFIDAHGHLMGMGLGQMNVDLTGTRSPAEVVERLVTGAKSNADGWLLGLGWDQNDWQDKRFPTRDILDAEFPDRPVWLTRVDGHAAWGNSAALRQADQNLDGDWQIDGGSIERDATGRATGVFVDAAMGIVANQMPVLDESTLETGLSLALQTTAKFGLTGVHEAGTQLDWWNLYRARAEAGAFPLRLYAMANGQGASLDMLCDQGPINDVAGRLQFKAAKFYADGALGSRGAALFKPYADDPDNRGLLVVPPDELAEGVDRAMGCGLQVNTHSIGTRGAAVVLQAYEAALQVHLNDVGRHRIEHAQVMSLGQIPEMRRYGLIASIQPTHATSDMYWAEDRVGPIRIRGAYAWQRFIEGGVRIALGSDFPVESADPLLGFYAAVTRQDVEGWPADGWYPDQRLTRQQALKGFTLDAAYAGFSEDQVGSLVPGKRADFVILSADIMEIPAAGILSTRVLATYLDGQPIYQVPEFQ